MIIGIPVEDNSMNGNVSDNFGRTKYFLVFDDKNEEARFLENSAANSQGGAGIEAAQILVDQNIDSLITPRCGKNAADVLKSANITIYKSTSNSIKENLKSLKEGILSPLLDIHPGLHGHGSK